MVAINPKEIIAQFSGIAERYLKNPTDLKKILDVATKTAASKSTTGPIDELFAKVKLLIGMISDTISKKYSAIPWGSLVSIVAALIYFVSPIDLIPDYIPGAGYIDDGAVVAFVLSQISSDVEKYRQWKDQQSALKEQNTNITGLVLPDIYRIEIPLPNNPLRSLNSYFIRGDDKNLLIDTGFNQPECRAAMDEGLRELGFSMEDTDLFVTHIHGDHSGLVQYLASPQTRVFCDSYTARAFTDTPSDYWNYFDQLLVQSGLKGIAHTDHPGYKYKSAAVDSVHIVEDGDLIDVGAYQFRCISTPGHAPDHMCLYEPSQGILFSGDHILGTITPNNALWEQPWTAARDLLQEYLDSLDKIAGLEIKITLPAHREWITDCYRRIQELKDHHQKRLEDILNILGDDKMYGAQVASRMRWDMRGKRWDEFSNAQKIFSTGEALSHLTHLVLQGTLARELKDGLVYYSRVKP